MSTTKEGKSMTEEQLNNALEEALKTVPREKIKAFANFLNDLFYELMAIDETVTIKEIHGLLLEIGKED